MKRFIAYALIFIGLFGLVLAMTSFSFDNAWYWIGGFASVCFIIIPIIWLIKYSSNNHNNENLH